MLQSYYVFIILRVAHITPPSIFKILKKKNMKHGASLKGFGSVAGVASISLFLLVIGAWAHERLLVSVDSSGADEWSPAQQLCYDAVVQGISRPHIRTVIRERTTPAGAAPTAVLDVRFSGLGPALDGVYETTTATFWIIDGFRSTYFHTFVAVTSFGALPVIRREVNVDFSTAASRDACTTPGAEWAVARAASEARNIAVSFAAPPFRAVRRPGTPQLWAHVAGKGFQRIHQRGVVSWAGVAVALLAGIAFVAGIRFYNYDRLDVNLMLEDEGNRRRRGLFSVTRTTALLFPQHWLSTLIVGISAIAVLYAPPVLHVVLNSSDDRRGPVCAAVAIIVGAPLLLVTLIRLVMGGRKVAFRNGVLAIATGSLSVGGALAFIGMISHWEHSINSLTRVAFVAAYYLVILNTRFVNAPSREGGQRRLMVEPLALHPDVQRFRFLRSIFPKGTGIPATVDISEIESYNPQRAKIYLRNGQAGMPPDDASFDSVLTFLLTGEAHAAALLLEPVLWSAFFVVATICGDAADSFGSPVWSSVLTVAVVTVRLGPDVARVHSRHVQTTLCDAAFHSVRKTLRAAAAGGGRRGGVVALSGSARQEIAFYLDIDDV
jgi:hypothetical protein